MGRVSWIEDISDHESSMTPYVDLRARPFRFPQCPSGEAYNWSKPPPRVHHAPRHARASYSQRHSYEVMVEFWATHPTIDLEKATASLSPPMTLRVHPEHALGNSRD